MLTTALGYGVSMVICVVLVAVATLFVTNVLVIDVNSEQTDET
jgi:hypothetical protein